MMSKIYILYAKNNPKVFKKTLFKNFGYEFIYYIKEQNIIRIRICIMYKLI